MTKKVLIFSVLLLSVMVGPAIALDIPALYTSAQVTMDPGKGDLLLAPIYDVRNLTIPGIPTGIPATASPQQTLINIVNSDPVNGVMVRVRFRSYYRSQEVLDFHVPLSKGDVFSAVVYQSAAGRPYIFSTHLIAQDLAVFGCPGNPGDASWVLSNRLSVRDPFLPADPTDPNGGAGAPFSTVNIADSNAGRALQRTLYGYFEVIAEEKLPGTWPAAGPITRLACGNLDAPNALFGEAWLVRVNSAVAAEYLMTAISNFSVNPNGIANSLATIRPNLRDDVQGSATATPAQPGFGGLKQLEFVLSKENINAQYLDDPSVGATTSVVVTFPTKWAHFAAGNRTSPPFVGPRETVEDSGGTDQFGLIVLDRFEDILFQTPGVPIFSPVPVGAPNVPMWPYEVNIIGIFDHAVTLPPTTCGGLSPCVPGDGPFGSWRDNFLIQTFLPPPPTGNGQHFTSGWINIDLNPSEVAGQIGGQGDVATAPGQFNFFFQPSSAANFTAYSGLPAIGVVLTEVLNAAASSGVAAFFNGTIPWVSEVDWTSADLIE